MAQQSVRSSAPPRGQEAIVITASGVDRPGITAELAAVLAEAGAVLLDVEQVVVQGQLSHTEAAFTARLRHRLVCRGHT